MLMGQGTDLQRAVRIKQNHEQQVEPGEKNKNSVEGLSLTRQNKIKYKIQQLYIY